MGKRSYNITMVFPTFFRGFKYGLPLAIISTIITKMTDEPHGHGEHHEEAGAHH